MITKNQQTYFTENGFLIYENLISKDDIIYLRDVYEKFLSGAIDSKGNRSDLSGLNDNETIERITQIMRPSLILKELGNHEIYKKVAQIAKILLGDDLAIDFDMLIDKAPHTNMETPWHQDEAYWLDLPDKRAVSCWIALDDVTKENGCMWFTPKSHLQGLKPHIQINNGGAMKCEGDESGSFAAEIKAGSCSFHHGRTLHYSRGNTTDFRRRAFIINLRPKAMIELERAEGMDHLGDRKNGTI